LIPNRSKSLSTKAFINSFGILTKLWASTEDFTLIDIITVIPVHVTGAVSRPAGTDKASFI